jgi:hypothetical protein
MRFLSVFLFLIAAPAFAACDEADIVTSGATLAARSTSTGRPLVGIEAVGGVTIRHRGDGSGAFTTAQLCDAAHAATLRAKLARLLEQEELASN